MRVLKVLLLLFPLFVHGDIFDVVCPFGNQNAERLIQSIPPELRNKPYGTYPDDIEYNTLRFNFNKRFNIFPKAIFAPPTISDAQFVLNAFKKHRLRFSIRSGGHCFEPGSLSSDYVFDLSAFKEIIIDEANQEAYIGAGCILQTVLDTLGKHNFTIPTGTCNTVGVTGLTLGGGIGLLIRKYGLTCDWVKSITLLDANGDVITVDKKNHPDLFWALKGGGNGSYGIVLGFTFNLIYLPLVTFFELNWEWDPVVMGEVIRAWQKWNEDLTPSISTSLRLEYKDMKVRIRLVGIKTGSKPFTEWEKAFAHLDPSNVTIHTGSYIETSKYWLGQPSLPFNKFKSKIVLEPLSDCVIDKIVNYFAFVNKLKPDFRLYMNMEAFGGNLPKFHNSSFPFRKAFGWLYEAVYWPLQTQDAEALAIIDLAFSEIGPCISKFSYANATDYQLGKHYLDAYYDGNVDRLISVKRKYDPKNIFRWKQSIPLKDKS